MESMEITFELASPVLLTYPWVSLDGYLAYVTAMETLGPRASKLVEARTLVDGWDDLPVPLERMAFDNGGKEDFFYSCSIGRFDSPGARGTTSLYKMFCSEGAEHNIAKKKKYQIVGGQFKLRSIVHPLNYSKRVKFWAVGDVEAVRRQVREIHSLGKRTASGNGRVKSCNVQVIEEDYSLYHPEHGLNRPVPVSFQDLGSEITALLSFKPPYWSKEHHVLCVVPGGM